MDIYGILVLVFCFLSLFYIIYRNVEEGNKFTSKEKIELFIFFVIATTITYLCWITFTPHKCPVLEIICCMCCWWVVILFLGWMLGCLSERKDRRSKEQIKLFLKEAILFAIVFGAVSQILCWIHGIDFGARVDVIPTFFNVFLPTGIITTFIVYIIVYCTNKGEQEANKR